LKSILEKSRAINRILKKISSSTVDFHEMAEGLSENMECSAVIIDRKGNIMGYSLLGDDHCLELEKLIKEHKPLPPSVNQEYSILPKPKAILRKRYAYLYIQC
jgi:transcriptional pleiotropic repressor